MVFSSIVFLFYFLPALLLFYVIAPKKLKNLVLLLASLVFYAWGEVRFLPVMLALSLVDFLCGRGIDRHRGDPGKVKLFWLIDVGANLAVLLFFKYADFLLGGANAVLALGLPLTGIPLPIGVSFNTFQSISYITDVKRKTTASEPSYYNYLTYTTLFPQIIAGPIVRYVTVENEIAERRLRAADAVAGLKRFLIGLGKKVLLANNIGMLWEEAQAAGAQGSVLLSWLGIAAFSLQIYFDFSGYSDMAIGLARMLGMYFDENFDDPYIAKSITEFWRRWHITLGAWFRDYVYIPLGGNRGGKLRQLRNILIVWGLTGFWHGASWNFLLWGLYFGVLLAAEKFLYGGLLQKAPAALAHLYTCFLVMIGFVLFQFEDMGRMWEYLGALFGANRAPFWNATALYYLRNYAVAFALSLLFATPAPKRIAARMGRLRAANALALCSYAALFLLTVAYLVNSTYNPFLYFRF